MIELRCTYTESDVRRASYARSWKSGVIPLFVLMTLVVLPIVVWGLISDLASNNLSFQEVAVPSVLVLFLIVGWIHVTLLYPRRVFKEGFEPLGEVVYAFSDEGIEQTSSLNSSKLGWPLFRKAWESEEFFFVQLKGSRTSMVIPKRSFAEESQMLDVRALLHSKGLLKRAM